MPPTAFHVAHAAVATWLLSCGLAAAGQCDRLLPVPTMTAQAFGAPVAWRHSLRSQSLGALNPRGQGGHTLGLTSAILYHDVVIEWSLQDTPAGTCVRMASANLRIGYKTRTVDVAAEIPSGSCLEREVLAHENRHLATGEAVALESVSWITQDLTRFARTAPAMLFRRGDSAGIHLWMQQEKDRLGATITPDIDTLAAEHERRQQLIDTPEEYARLGAVCGGEARRLPGLNPLYRSR